MDANVDQGRVLVVDDNEMNRDMLARRLQRMTHTVETAEDGEIALTMMKNAPFDLVLLDIMMPKMTGYDVLEYMKADKSLGNIPVIMISAVDDLDSVVRCIEMGADDYLFKPFNPVLLKARVSASLERRRRLRDSHMEDLAPELKPVLAAIIRDVQQLASEGAGPINDAQATIIDDLLEHTKALAHLFNMSEA